MNPKYLALICASMIFVLMVIALIKEVDGTALGIAFAVIGGLGGYGISKLIRKIRKG